MSLIESLLDLITFVEAEMMIGHGNTLIYRVLHFKFESKKYLVGEYFSNINEAAVITGYTSKSIEKWISGEVIPQKQTVEYFLHRIFTPQFRIIVEFGDFLQKKDVRPQLRALFSGHENSCGIYAFYDSMGSLL